MEKSPQQESWRRAMVQAFDNLKLRNVWKLMKLPPDKQLLGCRWVYNLKRDENGKVIRYKARLVAQGYSQVKGKGILYSKRQCPQSSDEKREMKVIPYRNVLGCLSFLAGRTRPTYPTQLTFFRSFKMIQVLNIGSCLSGVPQGSVLSPYLYNIYTHDFPQHSTVSTCLFADDSAVLSQGVQLKYTIKAIRNFLDKLETWLTHWRIEINVDKSQVIIFRKWGVIDPPFQLTLFDDNIQWVSVVKYLGLFIESRLTFKKHIGYLAEKFWGRIHLAISLVGRRSPLSLENKVILYKKILRPVITYGSPVWGAAAATHMKKIQVIQNKILRVMTNAPWYIRNDVIHNDLHMEPISNYITKLSRNILKSMESHDNPIIKAQTLFTYPHPKIKYAYSSTKWRNPLRPP
ncbi:RNA-directed DNA polymerase from mobile element jockey [Trichonephila clavipes]|nr:RNA-directed DNA polymerase from mobile element jockey [Trichonephila clavipes]